MASSRQADLEELAALEKAYRKFRFTVICHSAFLVLCIATATIVRRMVGMPPALLTVVLGAAFLLFGGDFFRFLSYRRRLRTLREKLS